jgi:CrcB protein
MNPAAFLAVAVGGAFGSVLRYAISIYAGRAFGTGFPWGTLIINVTASFVLGMLAEFFALRWNPAPEIRILLVVGVCGGYSTFSTFSLEVVTLMNRGATVAAALYAVLSVLLSVAALLGALRLVRVLVT